MDDNTMPWRGPLAAGRVAVVTGGAGAIGRASCLALAEHGADVLVADIDEDRTAGVVAEVEALGHKVVGVCADLTTRDGVAAVMDAADRELGRVDILVNGVGEHLGVSGRFEDSTEEEWDALYRVNLLHVMRMCKAVIPGMRERGWGRIINFSSVEGIRSAPLFSAYTAFKGAVDSLTKSIAVDVAGAGINCNAIAVDKTKAYQVDFYRPYADYDDMVPVWIPAGHYAEGSDVAAVVLFLASEMGRWVVGHTLVADGGTLAAGGWYRTPTRFTNSPLLVQWVENDPEANARRPPPLR
ncbi:MAG TPA: SDR family oxidoreductase [Acidimicrobiales bacterium]|nr:SDR family oxidoreductase [Acidimicrobiales bacterium]